MTKNLKGIYWFIFLVIVVVAVSGCTVSTNETDYKTSAEEVTLQELVNNPENYRNKDIKFTGQVLTGVGSTDDTIYLGDPDSNSTTQGIVVADIPFDFEDQKDNLQKGDKIVVYGKLSGVSTVSLSFTSTDPGESFSYSGRGFNIATMYIDKI